MDPIETALQHAAPPVFTDREHISNLAGLLLRPLSICFGLVAYLYYSLCAVWDRYIRGHFVDENFWADVDNGK